MLTRGAAKVGALVMAMVVAAGCAAPVETGDQPAADEISARLLGPDPQGHATRYPIVLVHGFNASPQVNGFYHVAEALTADGHAVVTADLPPYLPPARRAPLLAQQIDAAMAHYGVDHVNLLAHSMGGLDARYLISALGYGDRVASLTTISTPHRGSAVADAAMGIIPDDPDSALNALAQALGRAISDFDGDADLHATMQALTEDAAAGFNASTPDDARVQYFSWAGVSNVLGIPNDQDFEACGGAFWGGERRRDVMNGIFLASAGFVAHGDELRPNDGLVTVESARWGRFMGCVPADHAREVGQFQLDGPNRRTGFDHVRFYRDLAFDLAARGL